MPSHSDTAITEEPASDAQLLAAFVESGSPDAFAALVQRHSPLVLGVCRRMLSEADSDDAAQAVFVLFWRKAKQLREDSVFAGWLHRTAHHVCRNAIRSRMSRSRHEQNAAERKSKMSNSSPDAASWNEIKEVIDEEVNRLPDKLRMPFVLFHLEQRSLAEVAASVGSSVSTVGTWLQRARARLASRLQSRGVAVGATALAAILSQHAACEATSAVFVAATVETASVLGASGVAASGACSPAIVSLVKAGAVGGMSRNAWILGAVAAATLISFPVAIVWFSPMIQTRLSPDFSPLQGEWQEVSQQQNGGPVQVVPKIEFVGSLVISGRQFHRFQTLENGKVIEGERGAFVLNDAPSPKAIDFNLWQGTAHGIYQLDGDTLTICVTKNGGPRAGKLTTAKEDGRTLTRYQRVK